MAWVKTVNGALNLDKVIQFVAQSNGDVYCYYDSANYVIVSGISASYTSSKNAAQKVVEAVDASQYI